MGAIYSATDLLRARANGAMAVFDGGRNIQLRARGRVHAVGTVAWVDGVQAPAAACHSSAAAGPMVNIVATEKPVNCRRCLGARPIVRPPRARRAPRRARATQAVLPLFED